MSMTIDGEHATSPSDSKALVQAAIQSNRNYRSALDTFAAQLASELHELDALLITAAEGETESSEEEFVGILSVPGSKRAWPPFPLTDCLDEESPFYEDALKRERYIRLTTVHPMRQKDYQTLSDAVRTENYRIRAFERKRQGLSAVDPSEDANVDLLENTEGLDWENIAERVSESTNLTRLPREMEIRWIGERHPKFNHANWQPKEKERLRKLVLKKSEEASSGTEEGQVDWVKIAEEHGNGRTVMECFKHGMDFTNTVWDHSADARLVEAVQMYGSVDNWALVARHVGPHAQATVCSRRYRTKHENPTEWTTAQDIRLLEAARELGIKDMWTEIAEFVPNRNSHECKARHTKLVSLDQLEIGPEAEKAAKKRWLEGGERDMFLRAINNADNDWKLITKEIGKSQTAEKCRGYFLRMETLCKSAPDSLQYVRAAQPKTTQSQLRELGTSFSSRVTTFKVNPKGSRAKGSSKSSASNNAGPQAQAQPQQPTASGSRSTETQSIPALLGEVPAWGGPVNTVNTWTTPATQATFIDENPRAGRPTPTNRGRKRKQPVPRKKSKNVPLPPSGLSTAVSSSSSSGVDSLTMQPNSSAPLHPESLGDTAAQQAMHQQANTPGFSRSSSNQNPTAQSLRLTGLSGDSPLTSLDEQSIGSAVEEVVTPGTLRPPPGRRRKVPPPQGPAHGDEGAAATGGVRRKRKASPDATG